jgi:FtsH-binding integral membrane protein
VEVADVAETRTPSAEQTNEQPPLFGTHGPASATLLVTSAAVVTLVLGLVSFVLGMIVRNSHNPPSAFHVIALVTGLLSFVIGMIFQMISGTRNERIIIVTGMIAGFVGAALGLAAGGFS